MPGLLIGNMNTVRPRCLGTSQFVRARHSPQSDHQAPVVQTFEPFSIHSSPSRTARGQRAGDVGATARLGEELHPELLALQDRGNVPSLLLLGAELEDAPPCTGQRRHLDRAGYS